jgi:protein-glutamine gamma-glutamyltransferase
MNVHAALSSDRYPLLLWWLMLSGCAARFSAERSAPMALSGFVFWMLVFGACWLVRGLLAHRNDPAASREKAGNTVAILGMLLFAFKLNSDGLVPALLSFLFAIQAAIFIVAHKRLHLWLIIAAAFAGVMFAAAESRSGIFLGCAVWFMFASLGLLVFDQRSDREQQVLLKPIAPPARSSAALQYVGIVLALTLPIYLLLPKPGGLLLGGMQASSAHDYRGYEEPRHAPARDVLSNQPLANPATGPSNPAERSNAVQPHPAERLDAAQPHPAEPFNPIGDDTAPAARPENGFYGDSFSPADVQRDSGLGNGIVLFVKSSHNVYLRGKLYDRFEANRWLREFQPFTEHALDRGQLEHERAPIASSTIKQTVEVVSRLDNVLVHAPRLQRLRFPGPTVRVYEDGVHEVPRALRADTIYSTESSIDLVQGRYVLADHALSDEQRYLQLPDDSTDQVRELARDIARNATDPFAKALALEKHLRENYEYSYETILKQGHTPIDTFLFETKRGHCEFFASALAVMLRAVEIPARVATGFSLGEPNPLTGYHEVRGLDGHAWVEAYLPGTGWLMLEPTPFYPLPQPTTEPSRQVLSETDRYLERLAATSLELDPEGLRTAVIVATKDLWMQSRHLLKRVAGLPGALGWTTLYILIGGLALVLMGYLMALAVTDWRSNRSIRDALARSERADTRSATVLLAEAVELAAASRGYARKPHWTLREYVGHLARTDHAVPAQFSDLFDACRYSDTVEHSAPHVLVQVRESVQTVVTRKAWPRTLRALEHCKRVLHIKRAAQS